jgi:hypothetical protein
METSHTESEKTEELFSDSSSVFSSSDSEEEEKVTIPEEVLQEFEQLLIKNIKTTKTYETKLLLQGGFFGTNYESWNFRKTLGCQKKLDLEYRSIIDLVARYQQTFYIKSHSSENYCFEEYLNKKYYQGEGIVGIIDKGQQFYVYIKVNMASSCSTCDGATDTTSTIIYSDNLLDLIRFSHTAEDISRVMQELSTNSPLTQE